MLSLPQQIFKSISGISSQREYQSLPKQKINAMALASSAGRCNVGRAEDRLHAPS
jgi:hypothetical protein